MASGRLQLPSLVIKMNNALPESSPIVLVRDALRNLQRNYRLRALSDSLLVGTVVAALVLAVGGLLRIDVGPLVGIAVAIWATLTAFAGWRWSRRWTMTRAAHAMERDASCDNLLMTAAEALAAGDSAIHPILREELFRQTATRLQTIDWRTMSSARTHVIRAALVVLAAVISAVLAVQNDRSLISFGEAAIISPTERDNRSPATLIATVIPPSYTGLAPRIIDNPTQLQVVAGSSLKLEFLQLQGEAEVIEAGRPTTPFMQATAGARFDTAVTESRVLLIRQSSPQQPPRDRLLQIRVEPDRAPVVRIRRPAQDLVFGEPRGTVSLELEASDDLGLSNLALRYTTVSGSGEGLTFAEGELPLQVDASNRQQWFARGQITLEHLKLEVGDTIVYRAVARDRRPGADPTSSESFLIEIGTLGTATSAGFAVPEERDRQGLSQQMLIVKTERLHATRGRLAADDLREQSRMLAVEQRMVRAEFVFMTGGEVQDEVAEAEHGHELVEGRFENEGQVELLNAIREMSRAEARLNAGDTTQALVYERAALRALQRAFDRRRYLLRTLPERARIDLSRRLTGDLTAARSSTRTAEPAAADPSTTVIRQVLIDLTTAVESGSGLDAALAARIASVDPASTPLQRAAVRLTTGATATRVEAAREAERHLLNLLRERLAPAAARRVIRDPFAGYLADQLRRAGDRR